MDPRPVHYDLSFEPDLKKFTFEGTEAVEVECGAPASAITMDCAELEILSCAVESDGAEVPSTFETDAGAEKLRIRLARRVRGGATVRLEFRGTLNDRLLGFYRSSYVQGGRKRHMATTQFEAADARRAFPCWDEPAAKATFEIAITADSRYDAVSNMPEASRRRSGTRTVHRFERTPVMSTYLVYLGVGEFEYLSGRTERTRIRIVTTRGNAKKGRYALDLAKKLLSEYEEYFGIRYPLPKLDLLAIPDFAAGAMENWGAITFRETILLYDPKTSSTRTRQFIAEVISHEIAHQWFGNLVTMGWWNDLWLNESFATYMATKFVDRFHPGWEMWDQFLGDAMATAMSLDSLRSTHPIDVAVRSPSEIREIFDAISYDKGGCVLRMLEHYVGEPAFRRGLRRYLSEFKYANAEGADLWRAIGRASGKPVEAMVKTWLGQPGFPLVSADRRGASLRLRQERYLLEPKRGRAGGLWHVPVSAGTGRAAAATLLKKKGARLGVPKNAGGLVVNPGRTGFYRVEYDQGTMIDLKVMVDGRTIPPADRWAVQNDLYSLCVSGRARVRDYLEFTDAYLDEDAYLPAADVAHNLHSLYLRSFGEPFAGEMRAYAVNYMARALRRIGWDPKRSERHTDALLRSFLVSALGRMNHGPTTREALARYRGFLGSPGSLQPDLVEPVCSIAAWNGDGATHSRLAALYKRAGTTEEKLRFLGAMCGFRDPRLLARTLAFSQTPAVRSQNMQLPIMRVAANPHGRAILWPWLRKNWRGLNRKVGSGNPLFNRIVASISQVADDTMEGEIREFFRKNPAPGTERTQEQTLERIRIGSALLRRMRSEFAA